MQFAAHQQVEFLVGAAEFEIGVKRNRVVTLHQRVQEFVDGDRQTALIPFREIFTLENPCHRVARGELDHAVGAERHRPFAVVADLGFFAIQHQSSLLEVGLGVRLDLFARERRTSGIAPGGVADQRSKVANQKNHRVPKILQLAHLVQHDRMADMNIRRGRVETQLDAQRRAGGRALRELLCEFLFDQQFVDATLRHGERVTDFVGDRKGRTGLGRGLGAHAGT